MNRIVDKVPIATGNARLVRFRFRLSGVFECVGRGRTWVGGEADYLGTSKAVTVVALWTNEEGRDVGGRGIPPTLEAGDVYVLSESI